MRRLLLFYLALIFSAASLGQGLSVSAILDVSGIPKQKFDGYISKKGFAFLGTTYLTDTIVREYYYRGIKKKITDSAVRSFKGFNTKGGFYFTYSTTSAEEYQKFRSDLKKEGFFCNREQDVTTGIPELFQYRNYMVTISSAPVDTLTEYSFLVQKADLPKPKEIKYAEDLVAFNSHECLRYYFGDKHVKKDIYYLSDKEIVKCSILFPNTNRQAVFLWSDAVNNCDLEYIYIGGQLMAQSSLSYDKNVAENIWRLKSGIHAGMSLYSLRQLNDAAFDFYGGNSVKTGMVLTDSTGKLNFKKESVILGCMNCSDRDFSRQAVMNSDEAILDKRILFVHTIILNTTAIRQEKQTAK